MEGDEFSVDVCRLIFKPSSLSPLAKAKGDREETSLSCRLLKLGEEEKKSSSLSAKEKRGTPPFEFVKKKRVLLPVAFLCRKGGDEPLHLTSSKRDEPLHLTSSKRDEPLLLTSSRRDEPLYPTLSNRDDSCSLKEAENPIVEESRIGLASRRPLPLISSKRDEPLFPFAKGEREETSPSSLLPLAQGRRRAPPFNFVKKRRVLVPLEKRRALPLTRAKENNLFYLIGHCR